MPFLVNNFSQALKETAVSGLEQNSLAPVVPRGHPHLGKAEGPSKEDEGSEKEQKERWESGGGHLSGVVEIPMDPCPEEPRPSFASSCL